MVHRGDAVMRVANSVACRGSAIPSDGWSSTAAVTDGPNRHRISVRAVIDWARGVSSSDRRSAPARFTITALMPAASVTQ